MKFKFLVPLALYTPPIGALLKVGGLPTMVWPLGFILICGQYLYYRPPSLRALPRKLQRCMGLLSIAIGSAALTLTISKPAYGQFYIEAENFVSQCFAPASTAVPITFNVLRLILLAYLGVALVRAIQSFRNQEDWLSIVLPPAVVVAIVTLGDILSTLIVGGANC